MSPTSGKRKVSCETPKKMLEAFDDLTTGVPMGEENLDADKEKKEVKEGLMDLESPFKPEQDGEKVVEETIAIE
jgi:hypothetical protein